MFYRSKEAKIELMSTFQLILQPYLYRSNFGTRHSARNFSLVGLFFIVSIDTPLIPTPLLCPWSAFRPISQLLTVNSFEYRPFVKNAGKYYHRQHLRYIYSTLIPRQHHSCKVKWFVRRPRSLALWRCIIKTELIGLRLNHWFGDCIMSF